MRCAEVAAVRSEVLSIEGGESGSGVSVRSRRKRVLMRYLREVTEANAVEAAHDLQRGEVVWPTRQVSVHVAFVRSLAMTYKLNL